MAAECRLREKIAQANRQYRAGNENRDPQQRLAHHERHRRQNKCPNIELVQVLKNQLRFKGSNLKSHGLNFRTYKYQRLFIVFTILCLIVYFIYYFLMAYSTFTFNDYFV